MDESQFTHPRDPVPERTAPLPAGERISSIDTLRGVAVLGILLINILSFGLPAAAENNPAVDGPLSTPDKLCWFVTQLLVEGKMRALFSMLFGASVLLLTDRLKARGAEDLADVYYRRTLWLAAFGWLHLTLLWEGDILFAYGVVGIFLFLFRRVRPFLLVLTGSAVLVLTALLSGADNLALRELRDSAEEASRARDFGEELTEERRQALKEWDERRKEFLPAPDEVGREVADRRGGYAANRHRRQILGEGFTARKEFAGELLDVAGMMFIGMGLYRRGVLSARCGNGTYVALALAGYAFGIPLAAWTARRQLAAGFDPTELSALVPATYQPERLAVALGHVGVVMLLCKTGFLPRARAVLAAVGRMALTNYLLQTVLCTTFFYGYGLGFFDRLGRAELLLVVAGVWALELVWSPLWLAFFQFGPAEFVWRWLTYVRRPPLLRRSGVGLAPAAD
jgi:uncharacterized protein